jgi:uncharacterized protein (DUF58 family)
VHGGRSAAIFAAAAACAAALLLAGCGGGVSLATLAQRQQAFAGKEVRSEGTVERERDPSGATYYVLSDGRGDLVGLKPTARAGRYRGERVSVRGRFEVQGGFGRVLLIHVIEARGG